VVSEALSGKHEEQGRTKHDQCASGYKWHRPPSRFRCQRHDSERPELAAEDIRIGESVRRSRAGAELCKAPLSVSELPGHQRVPPVPRRNCTTTPAGAQPTRWRGCFSWALRFIILKVN